MEFTKKKQLVSVQELILFQCLENQFEERSKKKNYLKKNLFKKYKGDLNVIVYEQQDDIGQVGVFLEESNRFKLCFVVDALQQASVFNSLFTGNM